jgi:hypothetical protein
MKTLLLTFCLSLTLFSKSQEKQSSISFGPSLGIPSDFQGNWGSGVSLRGYIGASKRGAVLINSNVIFYPSIYEGRTNAVSMLKLGYKTQLLHRKVFLYGDAGVALDYNSWGNKTHPAAGVGIGYSLTIGERKYVDITPSWNLKLRRYGSPWFVNSSRIEMHFAYRFAFK